MEQVLSGGYYDLLSSTDTEYNSLIGGYTWTSTAETWRAKIVSTDGVIKQLRVKLSGAPGGADKYSFTLILNGNPTALTLDIIGAATTGSNMVNEITVTGGNLVSLRCIPTDTPTPVYATWSCVFEGDTAAESLVMGGSGFALSIADIEYCQVMGGSNYGVTELNYRQVVPTSGTLKDFYVWLSNDPGKAPDAYRFTVRLNGATVAQSLIVTITADDTTGNDLVHNLVVAAGDILTLMIEPLNTPSVAPHANWGMTFVADTDGESIILGATSNNLPQVDTEYNSILPGQDLQAWIANENECYQLGQVCVLKKFYVLLAGSPGAGNKYDFTIRLAGADSNVVTTIADAATTGNSGALEDTVALDEYVDLEVVPDSSPTIRDAYWGLICYIAPFAIDSEDLLGKFSIEIPSASAELLGKAVIRHVGIPAELLGKFEAQATAELLGKFEAQATAELFGKFEVGQDSAELLGKGIIRNVESAELLGKADIRRTGTPVELLGKGVIKNIDIAEVLGRTAIRHVGTPVELLSKAKIRHDGTPVELLSKTKIRHVGIPIELFGKFEAQATAEFLGKGIIRHSDTAELLGDAIIRHVGIPVELLGKADVIRVATVEFLGKFVTRHSDHAGLLTKFEIRQESVDLFSHFDVGQDSIDFPARFEVGQGAEELLGRAAIRHPAYSDLEIRFYVSPWYLTAAEMLIGGRDRRMDLGGLDREMVVGGINRRMKIK